MCWENYIHLQRQITQITLIAGLTEKQQIPMQMLHFPYPLSVSLQIMLFKKEICPAHFVLLSILGPLCSLVQLLMCIKILVRIKKMKKRILVVLSSDSSPNSRKIKGASESLQWEPFHYQIRLTSSQSAKQLHQRKVLAVQES